MSYNSQNYFAYKRSKYRKDITQAPRPISKANFLFQLFIATFIVIFIVMVISIMKYTSKMDIESSKDFKLNDTVLSQNMNETENVLSDNEKQLKIDKRLLLIQQEENAPSEAKIVGVEKKHDVIDPKYVEKNKIIKKEQKKLQLLTQKTPEEQETKNSPLVLENENITIMSKVLIGRFSTFDEARRLQDVIKAKDSSLSPFVKKISDVYTVQIGSFQDFEVAKHQAQMLKSKGLDVWIYQQ